MSGNILKPIDRKDITRISSAPAIDSETLARARNIVSAVAEKGNPALLDLARQFDNPEINSIEILSRPELELAYRRISEEQQGILQRTCTRVRRFAEAQLASIQEFETAIPGGSAGQSIVPIENAGCYAPGGRYPLPSSVIMTAAVARAAGCRRVMVASPNPNDVTLAAAFVSGADQLLPYGGAHAIAAMAYGTETIERVDVISGPGNRWVTAAKQLVFGRVAVDMLAGPSELLIVADQSANPAAVAADLLAQAEHDTDARTFLVVDGADFVDQVQGELERQLETLPTRPTAERALQNGGYILTESLADSIRVANEIGPEHLQLQCHDARRAAKQIQHAGCVFIGHLTAEVFGDYGIGPNHTLPTGSTARFRGGLSVFDFIRIRNWIDLDDKLPDEVQNDMATLAELEGLEAHKRACLIPR